jgi:integrase
MSDAHAPAAASPSNPVRPPLSGQAISRAEALATASRWALGGSECTREQHGRTLLRFERFCNVQAFPAQPASSPAVASYLRARQATGLGAASLRADACAIRLGHLANRLPDPTDDTEVRAVLGWNQSARWDAVTVDATRELTPVLADPGATEQETAAPGDPSAQTPLSLEHLGALVERLTLKAFVRGGALVRSESFRVGTLLSNACSIGLGDFASGPDPANDARVRATLRWLHGASEDETIADAVRALHGAPGNSGAQEEIAALSDPATAQAPLSLRQLEALVEHLKRKSLARSTREGYARTLDNYVTFCDRHRLSMAPAEPTTVCLFLAEYGLTRGPSSLNIARAAIRWIHRKLGFVSPTEYEDIQNVITGHAREWGMKPDQKHAFTADEITKICKAMDEEGGMHAVRDKAMLLLAFAGAFRRSEVTCRDRHDDEDELFHLGVRDLSFNRYGVEIMLAKSKTDQAAEGQLVFVTYGRAKETCAVLAVLNWLDVMKSQGIIAGPLFRSLQRHGDRLQGRAVILDRPLKPAAFVIRLKHWAKAVGMDSRSIAGHSLRSGHVTAASDGGASLFSIAKQGRWTDLKTVLIYHRRANAHIDNSSSALGI